MEERAPRIPAFSEEHPGAAGFRPSHGARPGGGFRRFLQVVALLPLMIHAGGDDSFGDIFASSSRDADPAGYGNILLSRKSVEAGRKAVFFSHWTHRMFYVCRVCHLELGFPMKADSIDMTMADNSEGRYCGSCHGKGELFGFTEEDCARCHHGSLDYDLEDKRDELSWFTETEWGNKVDWNDAIETGKIRPAFCLFKEKCKVLGISHEKELELETGQDEVPPVIFPHARHTLWLDCLNCHQGEAKAAEALEGGQALYRRQLCRGCHQKVAFPMDNCRRCHPGMETDW